MKTKFTKKQIIRDSIILVLLILTVWYGWFKSPFFTDNYGHHPVLSGMCFTISMFLLSYFVIKYELYKYFVDFIKIIFKD